LKKTMENLTADGLATRRVDVGKLQSVCVKQDAPSLRLK